MRNSLYNYSMDNETRIYLLPRNLLTKKKSYINEIGQKMRSQYEKGMIKNKEDFEEVLKNVLRNS